MSIQRIINICESIQIDRRRVVSVQYTRSEIAKTNETVTRNPWKFTLGISAVLPYSTNRDLLEEIDRLDRTKPEVVSFSTATGASSGLSFMFAYQGDNIANLSGVTVSSWVGNQLILGNLPAVASTTVLFKKGDFIQVKDFPYPVTATETITRGSGLTVTVPTHRPNWITASLVGKGINAGNNCQFRVFCRNMPVYQLVSGGQNALIQWSGNFELMEYTGDVL